MSYELKKHISAEAGESREPEYSEDGVDLTLIRWMLTLTAAERLEVLQQNIRSIEKLRGRSADG